MANNKKKKVSKREELEETVNKEERIKNKDKKGNNRHKNDKNNRVEEEKKKEKIIVSEDEEEIEISFDDEDEEYDDEIEEQEDEAEEEKITAEDLEDKPVTVEDEIKILKILTGVSICIAVITLIISLVVLSKVNHIDSFYEEAVVDDDTEYDVSMFTEITEDEFIELFEEDDYEDDVIRFVYTGRSDCGYCQAFLPSLQQSVEDYDYTLYYVDTNQVTRYSEIIDLDDILDSTFGNTPMVYAVKNGEVIDYNNGYTEYSTYTSFLEENGVEAK